MTLTSTQHFDRPRETTYAVDDWQRPDSHQVKLPSLGTTCSRLHAETTLGRLRVWCSLDGQLDTDILWLCWLAPRTAVRLPLRRLLQRLAIKLASPPCVHLGLPGLDAQSILCPVHRLQGRVAMGPSRCVARAL